MSQSLYPSVLFLGPRPPDSSALSHHENPQGHLSACLDTELSYAHSAQPHEHREYCWKRYLLSVIAEPCLCIDSENVMATAQQMQEALLQSQVLTARMAALETQLPFESARAQKAEQERSTLIQSMGATQTDRGGAMVDTKGIGQPFMLK